MNAAQSKLLGSLDSYWQTIVDGLVDELYTAYPSSRGDTRQAIGEMNGDPVTLTTKGYRVLVTMPDYYEFMDKGVHGKTSSYVENSGSPFSYTDKYPNIDAIREFMNKRSISKLRQREKSTSKPAKKGRKLKRGGTRKNTKSGRSNDLESRLKTIAFLIARSIYNKGLKASHFYSNVINDDQLRKFEDRLKDEFGDYIVSIVRIEQK